MVWDGMGWDGMDEMRGEESRGLVPLDLTFIFTSFSSLAELSWGIIPSISRYHIFEKLGFGGVQLGH